MSRSFATLSLILLFLASCGESTVPKPTAYPRIQYPERAYKTYESECPFTFLQPAYTTVGRDSAPGAEPCWLNMNFPGFNARLHLTYQAIENPEMFARVSEDAHTFAYKHTSRAEDITESIFHTPNRVSGMLYEIEGNTASSIQFFATDSNRHYLRGALYFGSRPNKDSLDPVIRFIRKDIDTLIQTLKWKQSSPVPRQPFPPR